MSEEELEFIKHIKKVIPDVDDQLLQDILENGIETVEQWEDAYSGKYESGADFSQALCNDCGYLEESNLPKFISNYIDWQEVWDRELRHDYFTLECNNKKYFFSRHF